MRNQYSEDLAKAMTKHMTIGGTDVHVEQKKDAAPKEETASEKKIDELKSELSELEKESSAN